MPVFWKHARALPALIAALLAQSLADEAPAAGRQLIVVVPGSVCSSSAELLTARVLEKVVGNENPQLRFAVTFKSVSVGVEARVSGTSEGEPVGAKRIGLSSWRC